MPGHGSGKVLPRYTAQTSGRTATIYKSEPTLPTNHGSLARPSDEEASHRTPSRQPKTQTQGNLQLTPDVSASDMNSSANRISSLA